MTPDSSALVHMISLVLARLGRRGYAVPPVLQEKIRKILGPVVGVPHDRVETHFARVRNPIQYLEQYPERRVELHLRLSSLLTEHRPVAVDVGQGSEEAGLPPGTCRVSVAGLDRNGAAVSLFFPVISWPLTIVSFAVCTYEPPGPRETGGGAGPAPHFFLDLRCLGAPPEDFTERLVRLLTMEPVRRITGTRWHQWAPSSSNPARAWFDTVEAQEPFRNVVKLLHHHPELSVSCASAELGSAVPATGAADPDLTKSHRTGYGEGEKKGDGLTTAAVAQGRSPPMEPARGSLLEQSIALFEEEFPQLMQAHRDEWVAYSGNQRLGFAESKVDLLQRCYERGLRDDQIFIAKIQPDIGEQYAKWELWDAEES